MLSYELSLSGGNGLPLRWLTSLLTLLAVLVHCYRFFTDFMFKVYAFIERNHKNTLFVDDLNDPYSLQNLSKMWFVPRISRLFAATLKIHPWLLSSLLIETVVIAVHSPPITFDAYPFVQASGLAATYTNETFVVSFMCLRLCMLPKVVRAFIANRYSSAKYVLSPCNSSPFSPVNPSAKRAACAHAALLTHRHK